MSTPSERRADLLEITLHFEPKPDAIREQRNIWRLFCAFVNGPSANIGRPDLMVSVMRANWEDSALFGYDAAQRRYGLIPGLVLSGVGDWSGDHWYPYLKIHQITQESILLMHRKTEHIRELRRADHQGLKPLWQHDWIQSGG